MVGNSALGECVRRHRAHRTQRELAGSIGKSVRWLAYIEAGQRQPNWADLAAIAGALGTAGRAFLDEASALLYRAAGMHWQGWDRLALQSDPRAVEDMEAFTHLCVDQSRQVSPGVLVGVMRGHLQNYFHLVSRTPHDSTTLKAGAAETALLTGVLYYRLGLSQEASRFLLLAEGLAGESGDKAVQANVLAMDAHMNTAATFGGMGGNTERALQSLEQALTILGRAPTGMLASTLYSWRAVQHAALGEAANAARWLETAHSAMNRPGSMRDLTGLGTETEVDLAVERMTCFIQLNQPRPALAALEIDTIEKHPSRGWRAGRLADLASAHGQLDESERAVELLLDATELLEGGSDVWRYPRLLGVRKRWLPKTLTGDAIEELDRRLSAVTKATGSVPKS